MKWPQPLEVCIGSGGSGRGGSSAPWKLRLRLLGGVRGVQVVVSGVCWVVLLMHFKEFCARGNHPSALSRPLCHYGVLVEDKGSGNEKGSFSGNRVS